MTPAGVALVFWYTHSVYAVVPLGTPRLPKSANVVAWPLIHFQTSLFLAATPFSLINRVAFCAVRQPTRGAVSYTQPVFVSHESCVHGLLSSHVTGSPGLQLPAPSQVSGEVHASLSVQGLPSDSNWHVDEQQSPLLVLPSSHCSVGDVMIPSPQRA